MCRFLFYHGPPIRIAELVTEPRHSLIRQSVQSREREEPLNGDGFGIAWYVPHLDSRPALFRSITPAWNNANLLELARVIESPCILAHVRAATQVRAVSEVNCHPFKHGTLSMMHNGDLGGFEGLRRRLQAGLSDEAFSLIAGSTDSEHLFAMMVDALRQETSEPERADGGALSRALVRAFAEVLALSGTAGTEDSYLNVVFSNGRASVVSRFTTEPGYDGESLHLHRGLRYVCIDGACRMIAPDERGGAVIVSSEPLSDDPGWTVVPRNHLVVVDADRSVRLEPIAV
ncbi:MAG: class II glutamine amidotransferase [Deltaproteobacteria bacterium]|nr:class II glutamine amidotransferase [Deltaproteobacteria bacterium]